MLRRRLAAVGVAVAVMVGGIAVAASPASAGPYLECSQTVVSTIKTVSGSKFHGGVYYTLTVKLQALMDRQINSYYCGKMRAQATMAVPSSSQATKIRARLSYQGAVVSETGWVTVPPGTTQTATTAWGSGNCFTAYGFADLPSGISGGSGDISPPPNTGAVCR